MQEIKNQTLEEVIEDIHRRTFGAMVNEAAAKGFIKGLEEAGFNMELLPDNFQKLLEDPNYQVPDDIWMMLNEWTCDKQAAVIYTILEEVHLARALNGVRTGEGPLGIMKGHEHLIMPIELAGRTHCDQMASDLHSTLKRFGLDKGAVQGKLGGVSYNWVTKLFQEKRDEFFNKYQLRIYDNMFRLVAYVSGYVEDWPEELSLSSRIKDTRLCLDVCLDAMNQIGTHF
ncbi:MAG: hypothetical protein K6G49_01805 [Candidatus Saccharibacteria bacterium]|nr:hypothetical protein [Candidatus Saccharibacteria bacterium]